MESVRRSQRVGRSKLGIEAVAETPAIEKKKAGRQPSTRKALVDVTNTCSIKSDDPIKTRVAKKQGDLNELGNQSVLKLAIETPLASNAKNSRKVIGSKIVTSSLSLKESQNTSAIATAKDSTVKAARVRKTKEQAAMIDSKVDSTPLLVEVAKTAAVVATPKESMLKTTRVRKAKEPTPVVRSKALSVSSSVDVSRTSYVVATPKDPVVKVVRGRKVKEQVELESNSGITHVSDATSTVSQEISMAKQKISGPKSRSKAVQVDSPKVIAEGTDAIKEKMVCNQLRSNFFEQEQRLRTSRPSKRSTEKSSGLGEAHSELKTTSMKPKRAVRSKKGVDDVTLSEFGGGNKAELLLTTKNGMGSSIPVDTADVDGRRGLPSSVTGVQDNDINFAIASGHSNCTIEPIEKISLKENRSDDNISSTNGGLVNPSCSNQLGVTARRKKGRISTPQSDMKHMKGSEDKYTQRKTLKDAQLQTSDAKKDVLMESVAANVQVEKPLLKPRIKRGTRTQTSKKSEKGASTEVICSPASNQNKCTGGQRSSGYEQSTGVFKELPSVALNNAPVQQTVRRNVARGARKPINYAEDDDLGSSKISTFLSGTSIIHNAPHSTKVEAPTVKQTMRKGRKKIVGATIAPTPICIEKPLYDGSVDLVDDVIAIPTTIESSLEEEYERFKLEKLACENRAKKPLPVVTAESEEPTAQALTQSADSVTLEEQCLSVVPTIDFARDVINSEEGAQTPARKFIHATRSPKGMVRVSPNLHTAQVSEQGAHMKVEPVVHVTEPSLSGEPGAELSSQTTPMQRGQKRGRKENNVMRTSVPVHTSEPERLLIDADVDAKPSYTSPPHVVSVITASGDLDKDNREFNGAHEHDELVDTDKDDGTAKDDPNRAVFEHEDQVCVDVSGKECNTPLFKPLASFDDADILKKLRDCCKALGKPSPLQAHALPFLLAGRDLVAIFESHAGHAHAYGVPVLQHVLKNKKRYVRKQPSPQCLVLADSSEVAQQISDSLEETYGSLRVKIAKAVEDPENLLGMEFVKPGVAILVTTPNCLEKMLRDGSCSLALVSFIVLDGADCMGNNGYEASMRVIFDQASKCQQIGVFSSTWESATEQLVETFLPNSDIVKVIVSKSVDTQEQLPGKQVVHQIVEVLEESNKDTRLTALLRSFQKGQKNRVLVYVLYKEEALHVEGLLQHRGWKVASVHGGIFEADRNKAVVSFQKGASSVLVATDVAARGLAIPNVDYVINYSFPYTLCDYARRLGQTGRTGKRGIMHTFFLPSNQGRAKELVEVLREAGQNVPEELLHLTSPAKKKPRTEY